MRRQLSALPAANDSLFIIGLIKCEINCMLERKHFTQVHTLYDILFFNCYYVYFHCSKWKKTSWSSRNRKKEEMGKLVNETSELCCSIKRQVLGKTLHQTIISYERARKESKRRPSITSNFSPFTFWTNFSQKNMLSSGTREKCQIVRRRRQKIEWDLGCWHDIIRWIEEYSSLFEFINMNRIAGSSSAVL